MQYTDHKMRGGVTLYRHTQYYSRKVKTSNY